MPAWTCWKSLAEWSSLAWDGIISPSIQISSDARGAGTPFGYFIYRETGLHTSRCLHSVALSTYWIQFQGRPCLVTLPLDWDAPRPNHLPLKGWNPIGLGHDQFPRLQQPPQVHEPKRQQFHCYQEIKATIFIVIKKIKDTIFTTEHYMIERGTVWSFREWKMKSCFTNSTWTEANIYPTYHTKIHRVMTETVETY